MLKMFVSLFLMCSLLFGCSAKAIEIDSQTISEQDKHYTVSKITAKELESVTEPKNEEMRGIWVSQFDMHYIYRDGSEQRSEDGFREKTEIMISNLATDGFNTIFLQLRPNGDSMFESEIYPTSRYIAGKYGGEIHYDAVKIFIEIATEAGISVHGWINPFRLCYLEELENYGKGTLYQWLSEGIGKRIELSESGILYLDPYYEEATALIAAGAREILEKYDLDGIHIDDYFYPTDFEIEDGEEFSQSGFRNIGEFRRSNIDRTVKALYDTVHSFEGKVFGISPAGNIDSLPSEWYIDIYKWCSEEGFADYIMPQLYFGFDNAVCPFDEILEKWSDALKNSKTKLYIGLSAAKCVMGSEGGEDRYAGEKGRFEWRDNKDILARSYEAVCDDEKAEGVCIFTYSSFYDPLTGDENPLATEEKAAFCQLLA